MIAWMKLRADNLPSGGRHQPTFRPNAMCHGRWGRGAFPVLAVWLAFARLSPAQLDYVSRFSLEKEKFLVGEPIFCDFSIENTGSRPFTFAYRSPSRVLNRELEQEPRFTVASASGHLLPDPAPETCGGAKGSAVYGSVSLPPGQKHTERWLLNQWARFTSPGSYRVRAERRLALLALDPATGETIQPPAAFAAALNDLTFEVLPSADADLRGIFQPYIKALDGHSGANLAEAVLVITTLPRAFLLETIQAMLNLPAPGAAWDRNQALEGLARLGTPGAWETVARVAREEPPAGQALRANSPPPRDNALRAYAVLLLGEKGDPKYLPTLLRMVSTAPDELRGDVLRALGFFHDTRANQVLFEKLHSATAADRVNAILGLRNLESRDAIPALLAMLQDPESQVRQVANFALESLTGRRLTLSAGASRGDSARTAEQWHTWWRENGANFSLQPQPPCHDW
jgi:hypothetical protein